MGSTLSVAAFEAIKKWKQPCVEMFEFLAEKYPADLLSLIESGTDLLQ